MQGNLTGAFGDQAGVVYMYDELNQLVGTATRSILLDTSPSEERVLLETGGKLVCGVLEASDPGTITLLVRDRYGDEATQKIPAIMLTARGYHLEPHDTEQSGILRMLSKPFSPRQLLSTVHEVLRDLGMASDQGPEVEGAAA